MFALKISDERKEQIIRTAASMNEKQKRQYLAGSSLKAITDRLQKEGYTNKYSSYSSWSSVRNILENETYTGCLHFGGVLVEHAYEPIISEEQFNAAQVLRGKRREQYGSNAFQSKHLLTGLTFCGHCGGRYYLRNSGKYLYYACYSRTKQITINEQI